MKRLLVLASLLLFPALQLRASDINPETVLRLMNAYRAVNDLDPLTEDQRLDDVAEARMADMEERAYWDHIGPDGSTPFALFKQHDYDYSNAGENLAKGFETAEVLVSSWMESPGHRANILGDAYRNVGIAVIDGDVDGRATGRSIVVVFGTEKVKVAEKPAKSAKQ